MSDDGPSNYGDYNCPCAAPPGHPPPAFVGDHYYCESGNTEAYDHAAYFTSDVLCITSLSLIPLCHIATATNSKEQLVSMTELRCDQRISCVCNYTATGKEDGLAASVSEYFL